MENKQKYINLILETVAIGMLVIMGIYIAIVWTSIPEVIPIHFDMAGNPDGYGNKLHILIVAGLAVVLYAVIALCQKNPQSWNTVKIDEDKTEQAYEVLRTMIIALKCEVTANFVYLTVSMVKGTGTTMAFTFGFLIVVIITLVIGFYKCKRI